MLRSSIQHLAMQFDRIVLLKFHGSDLTSQSRKFSLTTAKQPTRCCVPIFPAMVARNLIFSSELIHHFPAYKLYGRRRSTPPVCLSFPTNIFPRLTKTIGTIWACTITVVNLNVVPQVYLQPPHFVSRFPVSDVASYYDIRDVLADIWVRCLYGPPETQVGYGVTGESFCFWVGFGKCLS